MSFKQVITIQEELKEIKSLLTIQNFEPLDVDETAKYLRIKKSSLYQLIHKNQIPHFKPNGGKVYFNKIELNQWILDSKIKTNEEIEKDYKAKKDASLLTSYKQVGKTSC